MKSRTPALGFILLTLVLDVLGFGLLIPVSPTLISQLRAGTEEQNANAVWLLAVTYSGMMFIFSPMLGVLSDMVGRRPVILIAQFGSALDYFAMALSPNLGLLFLTRALNGLSGASMTAANAYVADITPPAKRAAAFGMTGAAFGLGFIIGPIIGGLLGDPKVPLPFGHGFTRLPFYFAGALTLINWFYGLFVLPESLPPERRARFRWNRANPIAAIPALSHYPLVLGLALSFFLMNLAQFGLHVTWVLSMQHRFNWTPLQVGLSLTLVGIGAALVQGGLARLVVPKLGERRSLLLGVAIGTFAFVGYGLATQGWMIYTVIAVACLGGIAQPAAMSLITRTVRHDEQGTVQGALTSLNSAAAILGPLIGGTVYAYSIAPTAGEPAAGGATALTTALNSFLHHPGANFLVGAIITALGWLAAAWATRNEHLHLAPAHPAGAAPAPDAVPTPEAEAAAGS